MPRATYSLRMSFWTVPDSAASGTPCRLATATYSASRMIAVALMVIDVETRSSGISVEQRRHVLDRVDGHADLADLAGRQRMVRVVADLRRQVECDAEAVDALRQQIAIAAVRLRRVGKSGVLPHRPGPAAIHVGLDAARERERAREADIAVGIGALEVRRGQEVPRVGCSPHRLRPILPLQGAGVSAPPTGAPATKAGRSSVAKRAKIGQKRRFVDTPTLGLYNGRQPRVRLNPSK